MNEKEIINLIKKEEEKLHEGVGSFSKYIIICQRIEVLKNQLDFIKSYTHYMKKTVKPAPKKTAKKAVKKVAKKVTRKVSKKK